MNALSRGPPIISTNRETMDKINYLMIARLLETLGDFSGFSNFLGLFLVMTRQTPVSRQSTNAVPKNDETLQKKISIMLLRHFSGTWWRNTSRVSIRLHAFGFLVRSANLKKSLKHTHSHSLKFLTLLTKNIQKGNFSLTPHFPAVPHPPRKTASLQGLFLVIISGE